MIFTKEDIQEGVKFKLRNSEGIATIINAHAEDSVEIKWEYITGTRYGWTKQEIVR